MINLKLISNSLKCARNVQLNPIFSRHLCQKADIIHSNIYNEVSKQPTQESAEIINLTNDADSINIPKSDNLDIPEFYFENDTLNANNIHGTVNLYSSMHANLPKPPSEAVDSHERPYDSIMSLGEGFTRNDKFLSEEMINTHNAKGVSSSLDSIVEQDKLSRYCNIEKRFGISFSSSASELISQGLLNVDTALDYQMNIMKDVYKFWVDNHINVDRKKSYLYFLLPLMTEEELDMKSFVELYDLFDIEDKEDDLTKLKNGEIALSILIEKMDCAIREIVKDYLKTINKKATV